MNTAVLIGLSVFVAVLLYVTITVNMETGVGNNLEIYCSQLANNVEDLEKQDIDETGSVSGGSYQEFRDSLIHNNISFLIWNEDFKIIDHSEHQPLAQDQMMKIIQRYFSGKYEKYRIDDYEENTLNLKICTYAFVNSDGELKVVQAMKSMDTERGVMKNAVNMILIVVLIGASVSLICGYFLSGRSLVPIRKNMERQREFLADASHELRTPIAVIQTNLEVVKTCADESVESQMGWIDNAYGEVQRMNHIVEDLMFLAKADSGDLHFDAEPVELGYLIMSITERFIPLAAQKSIQVISRIPDEPLWIEGDEKQLSQLLVILIDNAIKYSEEGTCVVVSGERVEEGVEMVVRDQGIGISKEDQKRIFERFYRVDKARSRAEGGTGLGLSIAHWIVQKHKGVIRVDSEENKGTRMIMVFPDRLVKKENEI